MNLNCCNFVFTFFSPYQFLATNNNNKCKLFFRNVSGFDEA